MGIPYEWIGTGVGALAGAGQRIFRMGGESRALTQQLREARKLLAENPHNDQYVRSVTNLTNQRKSVRKDLLTLQNAGVVARDAGIGGGIGLLGGIGAKFILKRPTLTEITKDMAIDQARNRYLQQSAGKTTGEANEAAGRTVANAGAQADDVISSGQAGKDPKKTKADPAPEGQTGSENTAARKETDDLEQAESGGDKAAQS
jgi:hypothetical protein